MQPTWHQRPAQAKPDTAGPSLVAENCSKVELLGLGINNNDRDSYYQPCESLTLIFFINIVRDVVMNFYQGP